MQVQKILFNNLKINKMPSPKFSRTQKVTEEDDYIKVPKRRYKMEQAAGIILTVLLVFDIIKDYFKTDDELEKFVKNFIRKTKA